MISRVYKTNFNRLVWFPLPLYIQNMSNCCRHKGNLSISRIFRFLFLAGFLRFVPSARYSSLPPPGATGPCGSGLARRWRRRRNSWTKQELAPIAMRSTTSPLTRNILIFFSLNLMSSLRDRWRCARQKQIFLA